MISLSAYTAAPVAALGLRTLLQQEENFQVAEIFASLDELEQHLLARADRQKGLAVLLLELSASLHLERLKRIASIEPRPMIVLWFDIVSAEYLVQAMALGVKAALSRQSSIANHLECLRTVAAGYSWIDGEANRRLVATSRVALAPRERHVTGLIALGLSNKQIAWSLGITEGTVKTYVSKLLEKLGVKDRLELALLALKNLNANQAAAASLPRSLDRGKVKPLSVPAFLSIDTDPPHASAGSHRV